MTYGAAPHGHQERGPDQTPGLEQGEFSVREPWIQEAGEKGVLISLKAPAPSSRAEGKGRCSRQKKSREKEKVRDSRYGEGLKELLKSARLSGKQETKTRIN